MKRSTPLKQDPSISPYHTVDQKPIRDADWEVMLPLTFDEVASLLLVRPRVGERPCFMSWHDSNTNIRSWHSASLSEGERAECRVGGGGLRAGGGSGDKAWQRHSTCTQAGKQLLHRHSTYIWIRPQIQANIHKHIYTQQRCAEDPFCSPKAVMLNRLQLKFSSVKYSAHSLRNYIENAWICSTPFTFSECFERLFRM